MKTAQDLHTVSSYDKELEGINKLLQQMGEEVAGMIVLAQKSLGKKDAASAQKNEKKYIAVAVQEKHVQQQVVRMLALRHPVANDLMFVTSAIKVAGTLERMAELSKKVSRKLSRLEKPLPKKVKKQLDEMAGLVADMIRDAVSALANGEPQKIDKVMKKEEKVDAIRAALFKSLEKDMMKDPSIIPACMQAFAVTRNFERVGDHAVSIVAQVQEIVGEAS